jgi:Co/Zn/Cd efflux system component
MSGEHHHEAHTGRLDRLRHALMPHSHDPAETVDEALTASRDGMRALWVSLAILGVTAATQAVVVWISGSVALLGDTVHNLGDALTAIPLAVAFTIGRRAATRRYTYGYGRAEDLAGILIVVVIAASAVLAGAAAVARLRQPEAMSFPLVVALAALVGFAGNEVVARYRLRVGRRIGSAALVADGLHARTDGYTSLAVLIGAGGTMAGFPLADPLVGLAITAALFMVLRGCQRGLPTAHGLCRPQPRQQMRGRASRHRRRPARGPGAGAVDRSRASCRHRPRAPGPLHPAQGT